MNGRSSILRAAIAAIDRGDLITAATILEGSQDPIDRENAANCRNLAMGGSPNMVEMLGYVLRQHLETAEMFGQ